MQSFGGNTEAKSKADGHKTDTKSMPKKRRQLDGGQQTTKPGDGEENDTDKTSNLLDGTKEEPQTFNLKAITSMLHLQFSVPYTC